MKRGTIGFSFLDAAWARRNRSTILYLLALTKSFDTL